MGFFQYVEQTCARGTTLGRIRFDAMKNMTSAKQACADTGSHQTHSYHACSAAGGISNRAATPHRFLGTHGHILKEAFSRTARRRARTHGWSRLFP